MIYPDYIKQGDWIGVTAISDGIANEVKQKRLDNAIKNIRQLGFSVIETPNVRTSIKGRSSSPKERAEQFMSLWEEDRVKAIIMATGGDFAMEMLDYLDFERIQKTKPKWIQGFSDITTLLFVLTGKLDIANLYAANFSTYGMANLHCSLTNTLEVMSGKMKEQKSFDFYQSEFLEDNNPYAEYKLNTPVLWKSLKEEQEHIQGRIIGGCFDVLMNLMGTQYDGVKQYLEKYKTDKIVWFLEIYHMNTAEVIRSLWRMKQAGYFNHTAGIVFGRSFLCEEEYEISFKEAISITLKELGIPVLYDTDIGHLPPQLTIVNGSFVEVTYQNGKGSIKTYMK